MHPAGQWGAERSLESTRDLDQAVDVDAGDHAHGLEHGERVLAAEVAGRARRKGTAANAADRSFEQIDTGLQRREQVGEGGSARVVEVRAPTNRRQAFSHVLKER